MRADAPRSARSSDPYAAWRCAYCKRTVAVPNLLPDHEERCEMRPTTEAG